MDETSRVLADVATVENVLTRHAADLGRDFTAYRNHVYRVLNFCAIQTAPDPDTTEKIAVAAVFHDLGIWTDRTFDYLEPSVRLASAYLAQVDRAEWTTEITEVILQHHKVTGYHGGMASFAEAFRRADWIDVTLGLRSFGLPRRTLQPIFSAWPDAGFRWRLIQLTLKRLRTHPRTPLPMIRL